MFSMPAAIMLLGCGASLLPARAIAGALTFLTAWTCVAFPVAVLAGHCMLSEDQ